MSEPENFTLALLREMPAEQAAAFGALRGEMRGGFDEVATRFAELEQRIDGMNASGAKPLKTFIGHRSMTERSFASVELQFASIEERLLARATRA